MTWLNGVYESVNWKEERGLALQRRQRIESFKFKDVISKLGPRAGVDKDGSVLATLADHARDRKTAVRVAAMPLLRVISGEGLEEKEVERRWHSFVDGVRYGFHKQLSRGVSPRWLEPHP